MDDLQKSEEHERELYTKWVSAEERCRGLLEEVVMWRYNTVVFTTMSGIVGFLIGFFNR